MSEPLEQEIRALRSLFWSERDLDGRAFAPLADAYLRTGETKEALDLLTDGMSRHPEFTSGHVVATKLYLQQGMHSEAEFSARRVLELDGENVVAMVSLAQVLEERGEADELEQVRATLARLDPESEEARAASAVQPVHAAVADDGLPGESDVSTDSVETAAEPDGSGESIFPEAARELEDVPEVVDTMRFGFTSSDDDAELSGPLGVVEDVMELGALAPDPEPESVGDVVELGALAPDPEPEGVEEVMELGALAPDPEPEGVEEVMELGALAPDPEPESVGDVVELGALAPDPEPEAVGDVISLGALAPDPEPEAVGDVISLGALAPDPEPEAVGDVISLGALAPDPEPEGVEEVMELGALAPDPEPEGVEEVMELGALAPDPEPEGVEEVMELGALAPDPEPEGVEEVMELGALAPDPEPEGVEEVMELGALAPDPEPGLFEVTEPVWTRTLAELYVKQGFVGQALDVFRHLLEDDPGAEDIVRRIGELESGAVDASATETAPAAAETMDPAAVGGMRDAPESEVEALARDLAESGSDEHDVDTPFAWTEEEADDAHTPTDEGPSIGEYFDGLLSWQPRDGS